MKNDKDDLSYPQESWDQSNGYTDPDTDDAYDTYNEYTEYGDYDGYDGEEDSELDEELDSEHNFRIAMNVFDLISILVGLAVILVLAGLLFSLFNWVQRDIAQSLSVITAPFR